MDWDAIRLALFGPPQPPINTVEDFRVRARQQLGVPTRNQSPLPNNDRWAYGIPTPTAAYQPINPPAPPAPQPSPLTPHAGAMYPGLMRAGLASPPPVIPQMPAPQRAPWPRPVDPDRFARDPAAPAFQSPAVDPDRMQRPSAPAVAPMPPQRPAEIAATTPPAPPAKSGIEAFQVLDENGRPVWMTRPTGTYLGGQGAEIPNTAKPWKGLLG